MTKLGRAQIGWLGELATDEANVVGSGGRLIPWIPLVDAHGVDRAYCWNGVDAPHFTQIKTSGFADEHGRYRWQLLAAPFAAYPRFSLVLNTIDPRSGQVDNVVWRLDSRVVRRLARLEYDSARRTDVYRLDGSPTHDDRLAPYRHTRDLLWKEFAPPVRLATAQVEKLPVLRIDQGGVYEFAMFTELMRANHKDLLLFRPAFDIAGRDLLIQRVNSPSALFVQIKGTAILTGKDLVRFHLGRNTFVPADDFWIALYLWDTRRRALLPEFWLVSSRELARRTAHQRDAKYLTVDAHLDRSLDGWVDCRHPIQDQADVLRAALRELRAAA